MREWSLSWGSQMGGALVLALLGAGCGDDTAAPVVGSGHVVERVESAMFVEKVTVSMPFHAWVGNGAPRKVVVRGEDNLLDLINIEELEPGDWHITAPDGLKFEQHDDIEVEVPYIEMVRLALDGDVELKDNPSKIWRDAGEAGDAGDAGK